MSAPGGVPGLSQHKQVAVGVPITDKETETLKADAVSPPWGREIRIKVREAQGLGCRILGNIWVGIRETLEAHKIDNKWDCECVLWRSYLNAEFQPSLR